MVNASEGPPSPDFEVGPFGSQSDQASISTTASSTTPTLELLPAPAVHCLKPEPGACRSTSLDSAYGTLSPTSIQEFIEQQQRQQCQHQEVAATEERCSMAPLQRAGSPKLRRRTPVQLLPAKAKALKSKSEANLFQTLPPGLELHLNQSRSLSELCANVVLLGCPRTNGAGGQQVGKGAGAYSSGSSNSSTSELSEAEELPLSSTHVPLQLAAAAEGPPYFCQLSCDHQGEEFPAPARRTLSDPQAGQHRKLTLSQLYRIRTTLLLNSTLSAS